MDYAVCQIGARQYLIKPGQVIEVDKLPEETKTLSVDKVMLMKENGKVEIGKPFLKQTLNFEVVGTIRKPKIRVATYKAKSNYRRVIGSRREVTKIKLAEKKAK